MQTLSSMKVLYQPLEGLDIWYTSYHGSSLDPEVQFEPSKQAHLTWCMIHRQRLVHSHFESISLLLLNFCFRRSISQLDWTTTISHSSVNYTCSLIMHHNKLAHVDELTRSISRTTFNLAAIVAYISTHVHPLDTASCRSTSLGIVNTRNDSSSLLRSTTSIHLQCLKLPQDVQ